MNEHDLAQPQKFYKTKEEVEQLKTEKDFKVLDWSIMEIEEGLYLAVYYPYKYLQALS